MEAFGVGGHGPSVYNVKLKFFDEILPSDVSIFWQLVFSVRTKGINEIF